MLAQSPDPKPEQALEPVRTEVTVTESVATDTPASLTILNSKRLFAMPGVNLDDRLRLIPGFTLLRRSSSLAANPTTQGVSLRGIGSSGTSRTLVLSDGIPLNDPFGGWVYWTRTSPDDVERVEMSRGATTSVFGDRAMGGTINFISPTPSTEHITMGIEGGNAGTLMPYGSYTNLFRGRWGITAGMRLFETDGYYIVPDTIRGSIDTKANVRFLVPNIKLDYLGDKNRFTFKSDILAEERDNGTSLTQNSTSLGSVSGNYSHSSSNNTFSLLGFHQEQQFHASFSSVGADRNTERVTFEQSVPARATGGAGFANLRRTKFNFIGGGDFLRTEGTSYDYLVPMGQRVGGGEIFQRGIFGQADFSIGDLKLFGGSRYQWTGLQNSSSFYSPSGGFAWGRKWLRARGSVYRAFRAPTLNELYREFRVGNTATLANPDLRTEVLFGSEVGADVVGERARLSVTLYRNELTDLIGNVTLVPSGPTIIRQRQNIASALARGVEANFRYRWNVWYFDGSYLFADSRFSTGERIPQVARNQGSAQLTWQKNYTQITAGLRTSTLQFEDDRNTQLLPGYAVFHVVAQQQLAGGLSFRFAMENAFDRLYLSGFTPQPQIAAPRLWRVGVRWQGKFRP